MQLSTCAPEEYLPRKERYLRPRGVPAPEGAVPASGGILHYFYILVTRS